MARAASWFINALKALPCSQENTNGTQGYELCFRVEGCQPLADDMYDHRSLYDHTSQEDQLLAMVLVKNAGLANLLWHTRV